MTSQPLPPWVYALAGENIDEITADTSMQLRMREYVWAARRSIGLPAPEPTHPQIARVLWSEL